MGVHLENLQEGVVYHYRVVATNPFGTTASEDQTFNFFPPTCPNSGCDSRPAALPARLPRLRARLAAESPATSILVDAPWIPSPEASSPARFLFGGILGGVTGNRTTNSISADTYVATRRSTGWVTTSLVGISGSKGRSPVAPPMAAMTLSRFLGLQHQLPGSPRVP